MRRSDVRCETAVLQARRLRRRRASGVLAPFVAMVSLFGAASAQEAKEPAAAIPARLISLTSPIDEAVAGRVQNTENVIVIRARHVAALGRQRLAGSASYDFH